MSSWDDGHPLDLRIAELLAKYDMRGTFYVPSANREGRPVMSRTALLELARRFEIGAHTLDHVYLDRVSIGEAWRQIMVGKDQLESTLGRGVTGFCYPGGRHGPDIRGLVRRAGFTHARTVANLHVTTQADRFRIPTTLQFFPHRRGVYVRNFARHGWWRARARILKAALQARDLPTLLRTVVDGVCATGGVLHVWGHSWEIEEVGCWHMLEDFLRYAAERIPVAGRMDVGALADLCEC